jgi:hypothetical protein
MIDTAAKKSFDQRFSLIRSLNKPRLIPESDQAALTLMDAKKGCFFTCFDDTYYVKEKNRYQEMSEDFATRRDHFTTELNCLCLETGHQGNFEWTFKDALEITITLERTSFKYIKNEQGHPVEEEDLDQIAKDKDAIVYAGEKFGYKNNWAALYQRNGKEEKLLMYEFKNDGGSLSLKIEVWTGKDREECKIFLSKSVEPLQITIMSKGAGGDDLL